MKTYSDELKASLLTKMLPPNPVSVPVLAREYGIPRDTLYGWRRQAGDPTALATTPPGPVGVLSGAEKFAAVVETASLNELELGAYCRRKGLFAEQIAAWRTACQHANEPRPTSAERTEQRAEREQINQLSKELQRKDRALAEAAALLLLPKKSPGDLGGTRGRSLSQARRVQVSGWIGEAVSAGARLERACAAVGLTARTVQRWRQAGAIQGDARCREHRAPDAVRTPANRLTPAERSAILTVANKAEFAHLSPHQIVPALADQGRYLASEATFYRVLRAADQLARRGQPKAPARARPSPLTATGPNQVWSWDITYLATTVKGMFFYLYLIMDVYSRKIVGWEVYPSESAEQAASVFRKAHLREGVRADALVLHSDNGAPMKGATMLATLQRLGVVPSFSRPSVSDDNPFSESLFNTLKGHPGFPEQPFASLDDARTWVDGFERWYNTEHLHSALRFVTPAQRHRGEDIDRLARRDALYQAAKAQHPERWSGNTRNWKPEITVFLNPGKPTATEHQNQLTAT
nr:IS3 family transposase [Thiorhodococcus minor]